MAGDWIKFEHTTVDKPEIDLISSKTGLDHDSVVGKCLRLWIWADQQSVDGNALCVTQAFIDRIVFHTGFAKALLSVGWLEGRDGRFSVPNFDRHNGDSAKNRAQSNARTKKKRKRDAASVTKASPEKRREEKSNNTLTLMDAMQLREEEKPHAEWADEWAVWIESWEGRMGQRFDAIRAQTQLQQLHSKDPAKAKRDLAFSLEKYSKNVLDSDNDFSNTTRKPAKAKGVTL